MTLPFIYQRIYHLSAGDGKCDKTEATRESLRRSATGKERICQEFGGNKGHARPVQAEV